MVIYAVSLVPMAEPFSFFSTAIKLSGRPSTIPSFTGSKIVATVLPAVIVIEYFPPVKSSGAVYWGGKERKRKRRHERRKQGGAALCYSQLCIWYHSEHSQEAVPSSVSMVTGKFVAEGLSRTRTSCTFSPSITV